MIYCGKRRGVWWRPAGGTGQTAPRQSCIPSVGNIDQFVGYCGALAPPLHKDTGKKAVGGSVVQSVVQCVVSCYCVPRPTCCAITAPLMVATHKHILFIVGMQSSILIIEYCCCGPAPPAHTSDAGNTTGVARTVSSTATLPNPLNYPLPWAWGRTTK